MEPGQPCPVWSCSSERVCSCPVLSGEGVHTAWKALSQTGIRTSHGYQHSLVLLSNKRKPRLFLMLLRSFMGEPERGADIKEWNAGSCQTQSKTPIDSDGLSYLSFTFKAEADYWMSSHKQQQFKTYLKPASKPQQWSPVSPVPGLHNSKPDSGRNNISCSPHCLRPIFFYVLGHKQCDILYDKDICPS